MVQLDLMIVVPLLFAVACLVASNARASLVRWLALCAVALQAVLLVSLAPVGVFAGERLSGLQMSTGSAVWGVATDGLSTPLVALTVFIGMVAVVASWGIVQRPAAYFGLILAMQAAVTGVFLADSLVLFYVAWECVLVPMYFLIGGWGSSNRRHAATKYLIYMFAAGAFMLVGLILAIIEAGGEGSIAAISAKAPAIATPQLVFWLFMIAFLAKVPAVGLHTWLPDAHTEAPTAGSILLAGVLLKMGGYGIMRIAIPFAPGAFESARFALAVLGVVGIVYGAAMALVQSDLKRLVAYSSVAHMGFVLLAIAVATPASFAAALVAMVSHGLVAGLLFFLVGSLYDRAHTRELSAFGGLGTSMPVWSVAFVFASLASLGLPGLSGFPGEFVTLIESFRTLGAWTAIAVLGLVLAAAYNLRAIRATVQGPSGTRGSGTSGPGTRGSGTSGVLGDLTMRERGVVAVFALGIVVVGVWPALITGMSEAAVTGLALLAGGGV